MNEIEARKIMKEAHALAEKAWEAIDTVWTDYGCSVDGDFSDQIYEAENLAASLESFMHKFKIAK